MADRPRPSPDHAACASTHASTSRPFWAALVLFWGLNLADVVLTGTLLARPGAHELNPIVALLAERHALWWFWAIKLTASAGMAVYVLGATRWRYTTLAWRVLLAATIAVAAAVLLNLGQLVAT